ncbi:polyphosphate kinase 1 [Planctomycetales bacterium ZRK34]|nr:polyphosphate kinase 1 [Planctomycetales bacterium ZRK34]
MTNDSVSDTLVAPELPAAQMYVNRELSWLQFNARVLHEALDPRTPLLERVKFLGIFTSNLDEFYMKRVGGLKRQIATGVVSRSVDELTAAEQLTKIREAVLPMLAAQDECFHNEIMPALQSHGIELPKWEDLSEAEREEATRYFFTDVFPVLTPLAVDPGHPFPFISNLSQSLGVVLRHPGQVERLFARVKVPMVLPRYIQLKESNPSDRFRFISLLEIIQHNLGRLFPDMEILRVMPFRITRNADIERDEEDAEDLLEMIEEELRARRFAGVVRLEHGPDPDPWLLKFLVDELGLTDQDVYELPSLLDYTDLAPVADTPMPALKAEPWTPLLPGPLADTESDIFNVIRDGDLLVHHPYESFNASVERFVSSAATDPRVVGIKMTLYRTGDESPFIKTMIRAAEAGKQVVCLVEVKARFDEQRNIHVAQMLEKAGVHVVYGIVGLKTHTKTALVIRREPEGLRCYGHIGTGNYHTGTAKLYTDLGLFTANKAYTDDMVELFHYLTGRSLQRDYRKLLVAPVNMRQRFLDMIAREVEHHKAGRPARIVAKMNSLEDQKIIRSLYAASNMGLPIDLIVRGFCCLRPGVEGMSENIRVISVIGRFLEHSRIFYFRNGAEDPIDGEFYIGSADWMYRNLRNRVEAITPIEPPAMRQRLWQILQIMLGDHRQAWDMQPDASYIQRRPETEDQQLGTHAQLMADTLSRWGAAIRQA